MNDDHHPNESTSMAEERRDALAAVFAEGLLYIAEHPEAEHPGGESGTAGSRGGSALTSGGNEGTPSCDARGMEDGRKKIGGGRGGG